MTIECSPTEDPVRSLTLFTVFVSTELSEGVTIDRMPFSVFDWVPRSFNASSRTLFPLPLVTGGCVVAGVGVGVPWPMTA